MLQQHPKANTYTHIWPAHTQTHTHTHIYRQLVIAAVGHYFGHYVSFVATPLDIHAHSKVARLRERERGEKVAKWQVKWV